jgi:hypothetical protein
MNRGRRSANIIAWSGRWSAISASTCSSSRWRRPVGLETAVRLIVLCIPSMTVAGFLLTAREVHGRIPPTALFALPLAYNVPFHFGFVNFSLSMAFAFLMLPLWLALGRLGRLRLRAAAFVPLALLLWLTHTSGWAIFSVLAFAAEFARHGGTRSNWLVPAWRAALGCLPLAPPVMALLAWRIAHGSEVSATDGWFSLSKLTNLAMLLRDRWMWFDLASLAVIVVSIVHALRSRTFGFARPLATGAVILLGCYLVLPHQLFGATYVDMRVLPYLCAVALLAMRPSPQADPGLTRLARSRRPLPGAGAHRRHHGQLLSLLARFPAGVGGRAAHPRGCPDRRAGRHAVPQ